MLVTNNIEMNQLIPHLIINSNKERISILLYLKLILLPFVLFSSVALSQVSEENKKLFDLLIISNPNAKPPVFIKDIDGNRVISSKIKGIDIDTCSLLDRNEREQYDKVFTFIETKVDKDKLFLLDVHKNYQGIGIHDVLTLGSEKVSMHLSSLGKGLDLSVNCRLIRQKPGSPTPRKVNKDYFKWDEDEIVVLPRYMFDIFNMWFDQYNNVVSFSKNDVIHTVSYDSLLEMSNAIKKKEQAKIDKYNQFVEKIKQQANTDDIKYTVGLRLNQDGQNRCTLGYSSENDSGPKVIGHNLILSDKYDKKPSHQFKKVYKDINDAYLEIKENKSQCSYFIDYPKNIVKLHDALKSDKIITTYSTFISSDETLKRFALYQGYRSYADYSFISALKGNKSQLDQLKKFKVTNIDKFYELESKMIKSDYSKDKGIKNVLMYLKDLQVAREKGIDILKQRDARLAKEKKAKEIADAQRKKDAEEAAIRRKEQAARYAKEHPYKAVISCGMNGNHLNIMACFVGAGRYGADTQLEITNGSFYKLYPSHNVNRAGRETREGLVIDLKSNFKIKAQNSADTLILDVKIYDRLTNKLLFNKSAAKYRSIAISN